MLSYSPTIDQFSRVTKNITQLDIKHLETFMIYEKKPYTFLYDMIIPGSLLCVNSNKYCMSRYQQSLISWELEIFRWSSQMKDRAEQKLTWNY